MTFPNDDVSELARLAKSATWRVDSDPPHLCCWHPMDDAAFPAKRCCVCNSVEADHSCSFLTIYTTAVFIVPRESGSAPDYVDNSQECSVCGARRTVRALPCRMRETPR